eukprot:scaffold8982_cov96-Skeletonema_dohrnii-CCMP3373.AAC.3
MANYNGSLEAVDCDIHSVRYDMVLEISAGIAEVGLIRYLRRCGDADMTKHSLSRAKDASILSWPTLMGH